MAAATVLIGGPGAAAAERSLWGTDDYRHCQRFLANATPTEANPRGYAIHKTGPFLNDRLSYVPFELGRNGSIEVSSDALRARNCDSIANIVNRGQPCIIWYLMPPWEDMPYYKPREDLAADRFSVGTREVFLTINGVGPRQFEIIEDLNFTDAEKQEIGPGPGYFNAGPHDFIPWQTKTMFEIKGNRCVPMSSREVLVDKKDEETTMDVFTFHTPLCKDLHDFFQNNPRAEASFEEDLNGAVGRIFVKHMPTVLANNDDLDSNMLEERLELIQEPFRQQTPYKQSPELLTLAAYFAATMRGSHDWTASGFSAVVAGLVARSHCYRSGLLSAVYDPNVDWENDDVTQAVQ